MKPTIALLTLAAACGGADAATRDAGPVADAPPTAAAQTETVQTGCVPATRMPVEGRASPYDSVKFTVAGQTAQICYNRPFTKGRQVFGGLVPLGQLWRTGANEPTILHLPVAATIAGVALEPGSYAIYTIPNEAEWTVILNRSIDQWGHESSYTAEIEAQEVGRGSAPAVALEEPVEQFTIRTEPADGDAAHILLEWERTQVRIPIAR